MRKLFFVLIIWTIMSIGSTALAERTREGYCKFFTVEPNSTETIFTVPVSKQFVLRKMYAFTDTGTGWFLTLNDELFIDGIINRTGTIGNCQYFHDFHDKCVIVRTGETLKAVNPILNPIYEASITLIGYFEDIQPSGCVNKPIGDLNGDCKVDFKDFAKMASEWLDDGTA